MQSSMFEKIESLKKFKDQYINKWFDSCVKVIYNYPYLSIIFSLCLTAFLGLGFFVGHYKFVDGADHLYALQQSTARHHGNLLSTIFPESQSRRNIVIISSSKPNQRNILTREFLRAASQVDALIRGKIIHPLTGLRMNVQNPCKSNNFPKFKRLLPCDRLLTYSDLCTKKANGDCFDTNLLQILSNEIRQSSKDHIDALYMADNLLIDTETLEFLPARSFLGGIKSTPCVKPIPSFLLHEFVSRKFVPSFLNTSNIRIDTAKSQIALDCVYHVEALLFVYTLQESEEFHDLNEQWEGMVIKMLNNMKTWGPIKITFSTFRSRDDELKSSTSESGDIVLVILTFIAIIIYCALINFSCNLYRSKTIPAIMGIVASVLGLISGMGFCCFLRLSMVPTAFVCPFLVVGIGVDDTFVVLNSYTLTASLAKDPEQRCRLCFKTSAMSITLTTVTSLLSFTIGAWSPYLSIKNFCLLSGASLFYGYIFCFTFFFAFICLNAQRESKQKTVCEMLFPKKDAIVNPTVKPLPFLCNAENEETYVYLVALHLRRLYSKTGIVNESTPYKNKDGLLNVLDPPGNVGRNWRKFCLKYYGPFLMRPVIKAIIIIMFLILLLSSIIGFTKIESGLDLRELAPKDSYLRIFDNDIEKYFDYYDAPAEVGFINPETPWWSMQFLAILKQFEQDLIKEKLALKIIDPLMLIAGDAKYSTWIASGTRGTFEAALLTSLNDGNKQYQKFQNNFVWEANTLKSWKMTVLPPYMRTSQQRATWMTQLRKLCRRYETINLARNDRKSFSHEDDILWPPDKKIHLKIIPWNFMMIFYESDLRIPVSIVRELLTAGVVLSFVTLLGIPDVTSGCIVTSVMVMIDLGILGFMTFWKIPLNMVSMVNLLISIGFAVDYTTHVCHTYLECKGPTREARVIEAIAIMGSPVFHGATASLLGIFMLGFSKSSIFRIFFKMMTLVIIFGMVYGVVFLPAVLSIIGPQVQHHQIEIKQGYKKKGEINLVPKH